MSPDSSQHEQIPWDAGRWRHPPVHVSVHEVVDNERMTVIAAERSDAWRHTSYGFVHDSAHALLTPFPEGAGMEVAFVLDYTEQFDQAGVYLHVSSAHWVKAGVEVSDGVVQVGAVVTDGRSDWSVAPVPDWFGQVVTVRLSRSGDAVTIRARPGDEPFRLVRVVPLDPDAVAEAGPYCCSPTRDGLTVTFVSWSATPPDAGLHG